MSKRLLGELELNRIYQRECIEGMRMIPDKSIDMILCDLPYGTTACKWDTVIPFEPLWEQYERIIKDNGAIVLTASQPFTSSLVMSNPKLFKHEWIWQKSRASNFAIVRYGPLKYHESVLVFGKGRVLYNPQMEKGTPYRTRKTTGSIGGRKVNENHEGDQKRDTRHPSSILSVKSMRQNDVVHPTQKPIALFEYLIQTYSNEDAIVLDNCMGSGTTAVAALRTGRNFIGFELEREYVEIANKRLDDELEAN